MIQSKFVRYRKEEGLSKLVQMRIKAKETNAIIEHKVKKKRKKKAKGLSPELKKQNQEKLLEIKQELEFKQKNLDIKGREVLKILKKQNNLADEFNNAMYSVKNPKDTKRMELVLKVGEDDNYNNIEEVKRKLEELEDNETKKQLNSQVEKLLYLTETQ